LESSSDDPHAQRPGTGGAVIGQCPAARRPSATEPSAEARLRALRERGVMLQQLNHAQMLHNMSDDAMWRSYYQQQDMIRAQR
jgi:hypothetical protein